MWPIHCPAAVSVRGFRLEGFRADEVALLHDVASKGCSESFRGADIQVLSGHSL